jgi:hypothetical protein
MGIDAYEVHAGRARTFKRITRGDQSSPPDRFRIDREPAGGSIS